MNELNPLISRALDAVPLALPVTVAFSAGADSTALLLACWQRWPGQVRAVHVHHGLQSAADEFVRHCQAFCVDRGIPLVVRHVSAQPAPGQSPEDAARRARYAAIEAVVAREWPDQPTRSVLLGHHADDQAETLLLALSRGAGLPGLSAMPRHWQRHGMDYYRPLLALSGSEIRAWLHAQGVPYLDDPTNADERFTRNRIRTRLLPALGAAFPQFRQTFARSAAHAAQAQELLNDLAAQDLAGVGLPPLIVRLQTLSRSRQANLLRHWLKTHHQTMASAAQLHELLEQIACCTTRGHRIHIKVGAGFVRRSNDVLGWYNSEVF